MCNRSEEGNTKGLGIFDVNVQRFSNAVKVPQTGLEYDYKFEDRLIKKHQRK